MTLPDSAHETAPGPRPHATRSGRGNLSAERDPVPKGSAADNAHLRLWVRLLACAHAAEQSVKARIRDEFGINQTQFNLLSQLDRAPAGIRMGELSRRTIVTGSNVTAVVDDLAGRGLVRRTQAPDDRRAVVIVLTQEGRAAFADWAPIHARWVREVFAGLPPGRTEALIGQLDELRGAMRATLSASL